MSSLERRYRQADEFVQFFLSKSGLSPSGRELNHCLPASIDSAWGILLLTAIWHQSLAGAEELLSIRPRVKRAIILLERSRNSGSDRSYQSLIDLIAFAQDLEESEYSKASLAWDFPADEDAVVALRIQGAHMQLAEDARALVDMGLLEAMEGIHRVLSGADPARVFDGFPHLAMVPCEARFGDLWRGLYLRLAVLFSLQRFNSGRGDKLCLLPTQFYNQSSFISGNFQQSQVFNHEDIKKYLTIELIDEQYGRNDFNLTAFPLRRIADKFCTSHHLILDSIAPWLMLEIEKVDGWKDVVSLSFERKVQNLLISLGYEAGDVSSKGYWEIGPSPSAIGARLQSQLVQAGRRSPGEIDCLAFHPGMRELLLVECKSMNGIRNLTSGVATLSDSDSSGWRSKLKDKADWIEESTGLRPSMSVVVLEGVSFLSTSLHPDVQMVEYDIFEQMVVDAMS